MLSYYKQSYSDLIFTLFSGKSTSALNEILDVLGMKKVHMMTFCPTRMAYLLSAAEKSVELLMPICSVLTTLDVKREQRDTFLSPKSMFVLHALADLEKPFQKHFLKAVDTDGLVIIDMYRINERFAESLGKLYFCSIKCDSIKKTFIYS